MRFFLALLSVCVVPFVLLPESNAQCLPKANSVQYERFSSVTQVQTMDSKPSTLFAGIELVLEENGDRVSATLRDYDGTPIPLTSRLEGRLQESRDGSCSVKLSGHNQLGKVEIEGVIGVAAFRGTIFRSIGKNSFSHRVSVRRKVSEIDNAIGSVNPKGLSNQDCFFSRQNGANASTYRRCRRPAGSVRASWTLPGLKDLFTD